VAVSPAGLFDTGLRRANRFGRSRTQVEVFVDQRGRDGTDRGPEVPDPGIAPDVLHELRAERPRGVHGRSGEGTADVDVERDREPNREPGDHGEGATRIGSGREDHPDEEEGEHGLDHDPGPCTDATSEGGDAEVDRVHLALRERSREQERAAMNCANQ
jgi:hypothetical protein